MWHAIVSIWHLGELVPTADATDKQVRRAKALALELIEGVGVGPLGNVHDKRDRFAKAFHLRRRLSPAEIGRLPLEWLAIEAEDLGGEGEPW